MRNTVINAIHDYARNHKNTILLTADLGYSVIEDFARELPDQIINVGISEQNMIGLAAGLALSGKKVFVYSIIPFVTLRCLEQIKVDVCYQNLDVNIIGVGAGYAYGSLGATHHAIEDLAAMRSLPNMKIICPADPVESKALIRQVLCSKGPFYIRLNRGGENNLYKNNDKEFEIGKMRMVKFGNSATIFCLGNITEVALRVAKILKKDKINVAVISVHSIKPLDINLIKMIVSSGRPIFILEEHSVIGGLSSAIAEVVVGCVKNTVVYKSIGIRDVYFKMVGKQAYLRNVAGVGARNVCREIKKYVKY